MLAERLTLAALNGAAPNEFATRLANVYERAPWVAEAAAGARPFASVAALYEALRAAVRTAPEAVRVALLQGHPDLASRTARAGVLTDESAGEQASAGLDTLSAIEFAEFQRLNAAYRSKFGFPFIICVRRHTKDSILAAFARRLDHEPAAEQATALAEIDRIAALRLDAAVSGPGRLPVHGRLSTHVLDTTAGRPAADVGVELYELSAASSRRLVARAVTNPEGRTDTPLIVDRPLPIGCYELTFAIGSYFAQSGVVLADPPFLDIVPIRFTIGEAEGHYHIPLLVTPWSYATYRGS